MKLTPKRMLRIVVFSFLYLSLIVSAIIFRYDLFVYSIIVIFVIGLVDLFFLRKQKKKENSIFERYKFEKDYLKKYRQNETSAVNKLKEQGKGIGMDRDFLNLSEIDRKVENRRYKICAKYSNGKKILDVGVCTGIIPKMFNLAEDSYYVGLDLIIPHLKEFKKSNINLPIIAIRGNGEELPFKGNSFDSVISTETLEHFKDVEKGMEESIRVANRNGIIIITVPNANRFEYNMNVFLMLERVFGVLIDGVLVQKTFIESGGELHCHKEFTTPEMKKMIKQNNLKLKKIYSHDFRHLYYIPTLRYRIIKLYARLRKKRESDIAESLEKNLSHMPLIKHMGVSIVAVAEKP